jgi:hypothetical protein
MARKRRRPMFKRKATYLMEIDAEVNYPLDKLRDASPKFAAMSEDDQRGLAFTSLAKQVMEVANEELKLRRLRLKPKIKQPGGDLQKKTGTQLTVNPLGEHHATFSVAFEGDHDAAVAATDAWVQRVQTFGGIAGIGHTSLRGTDGTNEHRFSEEITALAESLDEDTKAEIDKLMDPNRGPDS